MDDSGCCCVPPAAVEAASDLAALTEAVRCACDGRDPLPEGSGGDVVADAGADDEAVEFLLPISKRRSNATR